MERRVQQMILLVVAIWAIAAYLLVPWFWKIHFRHHFTDSPRITRTSAGLPGDPVNLAIEGTQDQLVKALTAAGWYPADPITWRSSLRIAVDSALKRPDTDAPVSSLFLFSRKQGLAFELPVGHSPRQRHHVRFWLEPEPKDGRPVWLGSATFDNRVGFSHTTGQITHHIGPDVDAERDLIMDGVQKDGWADDEYYVDDFHQPPAGRNGGGDPWHTDGRLGSVVLKSEP